MDDEFDKDDEDDQEIVEEEPFYKRIMKQVNALTDRNFLADRIFGDFFLFRKSSEFNIEVEYEADAIDNGLSYSKL